MNVAMILEMAADGAGDRVAIGDVTYADLLVRARRAGAWATARGAAHLGLVDVNSEAVPTALFASAFAGIPFVPINYRLTDSQLRSVVARIAPATVVGDAGLAERLGPMDGIDVVTRDQFLAACAVADAAEVEGWSGTGEEIAVLLFTSGTTGEPKAAVLRHRHLLGYVLSTVEFLGAEPDHAALVSVPPYHIAGVSAALTSVYAGRRVVVLPSFDPAAWVAAAREEGVTQAMVVPTMLGRILDELERTGEKLPALRHLSYGGGRMPRAVIGRALQLLPHVDFVNAYGLTETSSTIAVLDPEDHRTAVASDDPAVRARLGSVGRPLPVLEVSIRDPDGREVPAGEAGEIWVRGEQVSGEYVGRTVVRDDGWFPTNDGGFLDAEGYLFVEGRLDDVIVRGGENLSPGEIEAVLLEHAAVAECAVVGVPDQEWGEKVVAAVCLAPGAGAAGAETEAELQDWVRARLRSTRTPERISFVTELPYSETGKLLRRVLREQLA